ncbi:hypothetical protein Bca101_004245 [Brassica carinata]
MSGYMALTNFRQNKSETVSRQYETDPSLDENIDALLEQEEEAMMAAHRKEKEDTLRLFARKPDRKLCKAIELCLVPESSRACQSPSQVCSVYNIQSM